MTTKNYTPLTVETLKHDDASRKNILSPHRVLAVGVCPLLATTAAAFSW